MEKTVTVRVPGTSANCGPGFDAVGIACNLYNELTLMLDQKGQLVIEVEGDGKESIPRDASNIVWTAVQYVLKQAGKNYRGAKIHMLNRIPLARGLGSSAAAIVAGLAAANEAIGSVFNRQQIFQMATDLEGHPDNVAPAVFGGVTLSIVQDGRAECLSFVPEKKLSLVVVVPGFCLSTKLARKALPKKVPLGDAVFNAGRAALLAGALARGEYKFLRSALTDRLHQPYREQLIPGMYEVFEAAVQNGAYGAVLSGAGPCLLAFADAHEDQIGKAMVAAFQAREINAEYLRLEIDTQGVQVVSL